MIRVFDNLTIDTKLPKQGGQMAKPAEKLVGTVVNNDWHVETKVDKKPDETGGCFSTGYIVKHSDGRKGFLKAIDFSIPRDEADPAAFLQKKTRLFTFERDILAKCKADRLRRVVHAIDDGKIVDPHTGAPEVQFLIFELADGNLHYRERFVRTLNDAFLFRIAHHVATGLWQLHQRGIAHLDIKPSNVLYFRESGSKLADLGRSSIFGAAEQMYHELLPFAGDPDHAPIEQLYGYYPTDWAPRRLGADMYSLGSLVVQLLTGVQLTAQIISRLPRDQRPTPDNRHLTYSSVLPLIRDIADKIVDEAAGKVDESYRADVRTTLHELCDPEIERRGNLSSGRTRHDQYSVQRYVSRFDLLATRAEFVVQGRLR